MNGFSWAQLAHRQAAKQKLSLKRQEGEQTVDYLHNNLLSLSILPSENKDLGSARTGTIIKIIEM